jgi:hypothetical protein
MGQWDFYVEKGSWASQETGQYEPISYVFLSGQVELYSVELHRWIMDQTDKARSCLEQVYTQRD